MIVRTLKKISKIKRTKRSSKKKRNFVKTGKGLPVNKGETPSLKAGVVKRLGIPGKSRFRSARQWRDQRQLLLSMASTPVSYSLDRKNLRILRYTVCVVLPLLFKILERPKDRLILNALYHDARCALNIVYSERESINHNRSGFIAQTVLEQNVRVNPAKAGSGKALVSRTIFRDSSVCFGIGSELQCNEHERCTSRTGP